MSKGDTLLIEPHERHRMSYHQASRSVFGCVFFIELLYHFIIKNYWNSIAKYNRMW
jgi:hypothetical protein